MHNIRIKYIRFAHPTAQSLRACAAVYAGRSALEGNCSVITYMLLSAYAMDHCLSYKGR